MRFMIRFTQTHESFRLAEIKALALVENIELDIISYSPDSPFCFVELGDQKSAISLIRRSILAKAIYEVWGSGSSYKDLHEDVRRQSAPLWDLYKDCSFKFAIDSFQGSRDINEQKKLFEGFLFLGFQGPIRMKSPDQEFWIFEEWQQDAVDGFRPQMVHLGRRLTGSNRDVIHKYDLKKRVYISTTSMDAELSLVTANISLAAPGKLFFDPFAGTGSFPIACSHFGALTWSSDIDGRSIRGKNKANLYGNFIQYGLVRHYGGSFVADLTHSPFRDSRFLDGIVCDPPYGVREGLKVLGNRNQSKLKEPVFQNGKAHHLEDGYIPPKRPYGFLAMLDDILDFAARSLVDNGRLSFWMPTSNEADEEIAVPSHPNLAIVNICTQDFNKWSRKLITYRRVSDDETPSSLVWQRQGQVTGETADDLNPFRKRYFEGFR